MAVKTLKLRRADACVACGTALAVGVQAMWDNEARTVECIRCAATIDRGTAGASAAQEYERRAARERAQKEKVVAADATWRAELHERHPVLGRLRTAMVPRPTIGPVSRGTQAWATGATGEARVGVVLRGCPAIEVLHDRLIPGTKANIDHLVIARRGVFVVDAKKYSGLVEARRHRLFVDGRDRSKLLASMRSQTSKVHGVLLDAGENASVFAYLCFVDGHWPRFGRRPLVFEDVAAMWPEALAEQVTMPGRLSTGDIERVTRILAGAFPAYRR